METDEVGVDYESDSVGKISTKDGQVACSGH